jgi:hypothetical protein
VAVILTLVQTKQTRINIHKRNSRKKQYKTQQIQVNILLKHSHSCQSTPTHSHPHIAKQVKTTTVQDIHQMN